MSGNCTFTPKCDKCDHLLETCGKPGFYYEPSWGWWRCKDHWPATDLSKFSEVTGGKPVWYTPMENKT